MNAQTSTQTAADVVTEIKAAQQAMNGQLIYTTEGRIEGVSGLISRDDVVYVIADESRPGHQVSDMVGSYLEHVDAEWSEDDAYEAMAEQLLDPQAYWRYSMDQGAEIGA